MPALPPGALRLLFRGACRARRLLRRAGRDFRLCAAGAPAHRHRLSPDAALGVYHAGAEWKFWPGPETCAGGFDLNWGEEGIVDTPVIRCDEAPWHFLGLSFAGWNAVVSAGLA
ncbi:disulfide bond formation protein B [Methyloceanibacter marginalis]|uniref:disulfide bond formation protein B n=1 Tax=Methyloceanibacter marginalis TaxID=1774971 RepID=UPI00244E5EEA|nr:disulfide bond formation protein B [Methyloceanibacter marginalis]